MPIPSVTQDTETEDRPSMVIPENVLQFLDSTAPGECRIVEFDGYKLTFDKRNSPLSYAKPVMLNPFDNPIVQTTICPRYATQDEPTALPGMPLPVICSTSKVDE